MNSTLRLARWLGPWTRSSTRPEKVQWSPLTFGDERPLTGRLYAPSGTMRGAYLMSPGLHPLGPEHPVLDRFCRILAASGFLVLSPALPDHQLTLLTPQSTRDLGRALDALRAQPGVGRPAIFAVSFGVLPAVQLAAAQADPSPLSGLLLYGGHADFARTLRYVLNGEVDGEVVREPDLRLTPVTLMNLPEIPGVTQDRDLLHKAWLGWMAETWGLDTHSPGDWLDRSAPHRQDLPESLRSTFDLGSRTRAGAAEIVFDILNADPDFAARYSPITYAPSVQVPVTILHGADDPVIHVSEAERLGAAFPDQASAQVFVTGLYGHTKIAGLREIVTMGRTLGSELLNAGRVVHSISRLAHLGHAP